MDIQTLINILIQTVINYPLFFGIAFGLPLLAILWALSAKYRDWKSAKKFAFFLAAIAAIAAFFFLPKFFHSSLSDISYLTDWLFHIACVVGVFIYVYLVSWFFFSPSRNA